MMITSAHARVNTAAAGSAARDRRARAVPNADPAQAGGPPPPPRLLQRRRREQRRACSRSSAVHRAGPLAQCRAQGRRRRAAAGTMAAGRVLRVLRPTPSRTLWTRREHGFRVGGPPVRDSGGRERPAGATRGTQAAPLRPLWGGTVSPPPPPCHGPSRHGPPSRPRHRLPLWPGSGSAAPAAHLQRLRGGRLPRRAPGRERGSEGARERGSEGARERGRDLLAEGSLPASLRPPLCVSLPPSPRPPIPAPLCLSVPHPLRLLPPSPSLSLPRPPSPSGPGQAPPRRRRRRRRGLIVRAPSHRHCPRPRGWRPSARARRGAAPLPDGPGRAGTEGLNGPDIDRQVASGAAARRQPEEARRPGL